MLPIEDILCELSGEEVNEQGLPPGFRFHPTDEELITFYLASKVFHGKFCGLNIAEVDLNRCEPWELPEVAKMGEKEWYFFSLKDRKYPTGLRTNRATIAGYWKATGKDREVFSGTSGSLLGMKKTLVFYKGRAPRGEKTKWVMHEYRLDGDFSCRHTCKEEWVICRIFHKLGEKKNPLLQGQSYLFEASTSPNTGPFPALLETSTTKTPPALLESQSQNPMQQSLHTTFLIHHQENDLKSLVNNNPIVPQPDNIFSLNGFQQQQQPPFSPTHSTMTKVNKGTTATAFNNCHPSLTTNLLRSLLSNQDCNFKEQITTMPKQCKSEANLSHFPLVGELWGAADKIQPNTFQSSLPFGMDSSLMGYPNPSSAATAATDTTVHDMSINKAGFQMLLDPPIKVTEGSWPLGL